MKISKCLLLLMLASTMFGCAYAGVTSVGKGKVLVERNDFALFGFLRKVVVCDASSAGLSNCQEQEQP